MLDGLDCRFDEVGGFLRGIRGLTGEVTYLIGYDGEALAGWKAISSIALMMFSI